MNGDREMLEGRMMAETTVDYPGTGANNHHDPKTPGRAWLLLFVTFCFKFAVSLFL